MTETRLRRHPFVEDYEGLKKFCPGCNDFMLVKFFSRRKSGARRGEYLSRCKDCMCKPRVRHNEISGYVPLPKVWYIFDEIAQRVGQARGAEIIGITTEAYRSILYRRQFNVQRRRVYHAITYLRCLRADNVWDAPKVGRPLRYAPDRCIGCGCDLADYVIGCSVCVDRRVKRKQRFREQGVMILTRAQIVGLYGLAMNMPIDTKVDVLSVDTSGHIIVQARSESSDKTARYRVPTQGGVENLGD